MTKNKIFFEGLVVISETDFAVAHPRVFKLYSSKEQVNLCRRRYRSDTLSSRKQEGGTTQRKHGD